MRPAVLASLVVLVLAAEDHAQACTPAAPPEHELDPRARATDRQPPGAASVGEVRVRRGRGGSGGACGDLARIDLPLAARDDTTPPDRMGFKVELLAGKLPGGGSDAHGGPTRIVPTWTLGLTRGLVWLYWFESDVDLMPLDVTLRITSVDLAGHEGPPIDVRVRDDGLAGGSSTGHDVASATRACTRGDAAACVWLGKRHLHGVGAPGDAPRAEALYRRGCDLGDGLGCELLAARCRADASRDKAACQAILDRAGALYDARCQQGDGAVCHELAWFHVRHQRGWPNDQAQEAHLRACEHGFYPSCQEIDDGSATNRAHRRKLSGLTRLCHQGHGAACRALAAEQPDEGAALSLRRRACKLGELPACVDVADWLLGLDPQVPAEALEGYQLACDGLLDDTVCEGASALRDLAGARAPSPRVTDALRSFEARCRRSHGDAPLCAFVALHHERGHLVRRSDAGVVLRRDACEAGHGPSCRWLADAALAGPDRGLALDEAARWLDEGCSRASAPSCVALGQVCDRLRGASPDGARRKKTCRGVGVDWQPWGLQLARASLAACVVGHADLCMRALRISLAGHDVTGGLEAARAGCALADQSLCTYVAGQVAVQGEVFQADGAPAARQKVIVSTEGQEDALCRRELWSDVHGRFSGAVCSGTVRISVAHRGQDERVVARTAVDVRHPTQVVLRTLPQGLRPPAQRGELGLSLRRVLGQLEIAAVEPGGPADAAGLRRGDRVLAVDGHPIGPEAFQPETLADYVTSAATGQVFVFEVVRGRQRLTLQVTARAAAAP
jgi:TPR repeat protein